jgi:hypothetical protein
MVDVETEPLVERQKIVAGFVGAAVSFSFLLPMFAQVDAYWVGASPGL